ncbi:hypothetical protein HDC96_001817 [Stenotrophomonas sp. JAI102]|nr:hypothetical protein [Stenotrophomonas sp. JAI102]
MRRVWRITWYRATGSDYFFGTIVMCPLISSTASALTGTEVVKRGRLTTSVPVIFYFFGTIVMCPLISSTARATSSIDRQPC